MLDPDYNDVRSRTIIGSKWIKHFRPSAWISYQIKMPPAVTVTQLYKQRWKIELFFRWIKQNLKVQSFWGYSENAVKTQVWIAISVYVLVAIAKKKLKLEYSPYEILQYISLAPFEKLPLREVFLNNKHHDVIELNCIQVKLL